MTIHLTIKKPILREYLQYLFPCLDDGSFQVTKTTDFGRAMCSFVRYSNHPIQNTKEAVTFLLPQVDSLTNARNYHLYYTREDQKKLNDLLALIFDLDLDRYYLAGLQTGEMKKDIIMSFIATRKLSKLLSDHDTLKKRVYREELHLLHQRVKKLTNHAYYRNHRIEYEKRQLYAS